MSPRPPLVRAVTVRPALPATELAYVRARLLGLRSRYVVAALAIEHDQDGLVVRYDAPADPPTLAARLAAGRPLGLPEAVRLAADVAWGLAAAAAAGLSHGRLDATQIVLGDGPARILGVGLGGLDAAPPPGGDVVAPEVRAGGPPTEAADLWSLGVLLRDLTAGTALPLKLADLVARMLDGHPSRRPAAAQAVAARLVALGIASPHVDAGPRRPRGDHAPPGPPAAAAPAAAAPAATAPAATAPPAAAPAAAPPAGPPQVARRRPAARPASPTPRPPAPPAPLPRVAALRSPSPTRRAPRAAPAGPPSTPPVPPVTAPRAVHPTPPEGIAPPAPAPVPPAEVAGVAERGRHARASWRRRGMVPDPPFAALAAPSSPAPDSPPAPAPGTRRGRHAAGAGPSPEEPAGTPLPPPLAWSGTAYPPRWGRRPLAIAVAIAVLIAAGVLVALATRGSDATAQRPAAPTASAPVAAASTLAPNPSTSVRIPLPIVAATVPVDPVAVARLRGMALQPADVAPAATALTVPEQSNFDALLRALYAECDYFSPVGQPPSAHRFTGFVDGDVEVFDDLTTYPTGVPAQVVAGVATAITKCPTISVPSGNASDAPAAFAVTRIAPPAGVPTDAVALTYERTDQSEDDVRAVFLSTGTTLRVVLAVGPSLGQTESDWRAAAAHAWTRLVAAH